MATKFKMKWVLNKTESKKRVLIMCSKLLHCVNELLYKYSDNNLHCNIVGILSNHTDASKIANYNNINFKHIPINQASKEEDIAKMSKAIDDFNPEVIVLARYMQIIPKEVCDKYKYKIINIHHSFLPSFIGANPYHRAYNRGVKLIGATCHYVTKELDSGPIIEQDVARITHSKSIKDIEKIGQDVEKIVLVTGLKYHLEDRNLICNNRTIVLT
jgi:formyltetrahydrofolate deformylase